MHPRPFYDLEVCPLTKAELHSLDFAVTRFLTKLFKTSSIVLLLYKTAVDDSAYNCQANFSENGSRNLCLDVAHYVTVFITKAARATERGVQAVHCTGAHDQKRGPNTNFHCFDFEV